MMNYSLAQQNEIKEFLKSGSHDGNHILWPGGFTERHRFGDQALREALITEIKSRSQGKKPIQEIPNIDILIFAKNKVNSMVRGLFPEHEQELVLSVLSSSIVFMSQENIEQIILETRWVHTAWSLANLYLVSLGVDPVGSEEHDGVNIVGLSQETTCYVSLEYFNCDDKFADFVVHEAAHIFHNCKRETIGLPETPKREWLLDIDFVQRETFAYSCEVYSRICELGKTSRERKTLLEEYTRGSLPTDDRADVPRHLEALELAVASRDVRCGWMKILKICASRK
jgi:hypothetical protein